MTEAVNDFSKMAPRSGVNLSAIVLAAGQSRRMGRPKMNLPWGNQTVIEQVVSVIALGNLGEIIVVTGGARKDVEDLLKRMDVPIPVRTVFNPDFADGEMTRSLQIGLASVQSISQAAMVVLGDQPQIERQVVEQVVAAYQSGSANLIVPSYQMRRGHPWIVARLFWPDLLALKPPKTLRDFLKIHAGDIQYILVENASILADLDTPEDYQRAVGCK